MLHSQSALSRSIATQRERETALGLRTVDDINVRVIPLAKCRGRLDGDSLFSFQFHAVHFCPDPIFSTNIVDRIDLSRIKKDSFGQGRLPTVDVCTDSDVS